jgi:hypothetical protein
MPWLRIDDRMHRNEKVLAVSNDAKVLWIWAMDYSADYLTDGILKPHEVQYLAAQNNITDWQTVTAELLQADLFERKGDKYIVHDYLDYNPTREKVLAERAESAKRQAEFQAKRKARRDDEDDIDDKVRDPEGWARRLEPQPNGITNTVDNGVSNGLALDRPVPDPVPVPIPTPEEKNEHVAPDGAREPDEKPKAEYSPEFEQFWAVYPRKLEKREAFRCWLARLKGGAKPDGMIAAAKNYAIYCERHNVEMRFVKHASTFLGPSRPFEEYVLGPPDERGPNRNPGNGQVRSFRDRREVSRAARGRGSEQDGPAGGYTIEEFNRRYPEKSG